MTNHELLKKILSKLEIVELKQSFIIKKLRIMGQGQDQLNASLQELDDATTAIAARIDAFIAAEANNVSQESLDSLQAVADQLKALGTDPNNPLGTTPTADPGTTDAGSGN